MTRKREALTLSVSPEAKANLEAIAASLGITWGGGRGNVSRMIERIGTGELTVVAKPNHQLKVNESLKAVERTLEEALKAIKKAR